MENEVIILKEAESFIDTLPIKFQAKTYWTLQLLERFGIKLTQPYTKNVKGYKNIKELRVKFGSDINRLFYFNYKSKIFVVTSGYIKKSMKLDKLEIERAVKIMERFIKEQEGEKA
ncbi:MAG: type II toxin-antitoxin system RelE/ParE family toxin [bacterium]